MANLGIIQERMQVETAVSAPMERAISLWMRMYVDDAPWLDEETTSMNLPAFIATEVARMATIEMESVASGSPRADYLNEQYQRVIGSIRTIVEYAAAGGSIALKPCPKDGEIVVDIVRAGNFFPTAFSSSGDVTGCVFVDTITKGDTLYTRLEHHAMEAGGCRVTNKAFRTETGGDDLGEDIPLTLIPEWADLSPDHLAPVEQPLFAILNMPYANTIDPDSPLGVSSYARAVDLIEKADKQFSRLLWEMESGNRALYVGMQAFAPDEADPGQLPLKRFYRMMDLQPGADTLFESWSPEFREQNQINALNEIMQRIEDACGLSRGTISRAPESAAGGAKTATELKIMRQRTYTTVRDTQKAIEATLRSLLVAMDAWTTMENLARPGTYEVSFAFDDSVINDPDAEAAEAWQWVVAGRFPFWRYLVNYKGYTEQEARQIEREAGGAYQRMFEDEEE